MATRDQPKIALQHFYEWGDHYTLRNLDFPVDSPIANCKLHDQTYGQLLNNLRVTSKFPTERDRVGRKGRFNEFDRAEQDMIAKGMGKLQQTPLTLYIRRYYGNANFLAESRAVSAYLFKTLDGSGPRSESFARLQTLYKSCLHYARPALLNKKPNPDDIWEHLRADDEYMSILMGAQYQVKRWLRRIKSCRRVTWRKKDSAIGSSPLPPYGPEIDVGLVGSFMTKYLDPIHKYSQIALHQEFEITDEATDVFDYLLPGGYWDVVDEMEDLDLEAELVERKMMEQGFDMDALDKLDAKVKETYTKLQKIKSIYDLDKSLLFQRTLDGAGIIATDKGIWVGKRHEQVIYLHETELHDIEIYLSELIANYIACQQDWGKKTAVEYLKCMCQTYSFISETSYDIANYAPCLHRDYELKQQENWCLNRCEAFKWEDHGPYKHLVSVWDQFCGTDVSQCYPKARMIRCLGQVYFFPMTLLNEHARCLTLCKEPEPEELKRLEASMNFLIAKVHHQKTGIHLQHIQDKVTDEDLDETQRIRLENDVFIGLEHYEGMKFHGEGADLFDPFAARCKDSTNVPNDLKVVTEHNYWEKLTPNVKREIHVLGKYNETDILEIAKKNVEEQLKNDVHFVVRFTVKPEQKEAGRTVTMESTWVRALSTIAEKNIVPFSRHYFGSMLGKNPTKKLQGIETALRASVNAQRRGKAVIYIMMDFKKFGHTIGFNIDKMILQKCADYYGVDWVSSHLDALKKSRYGASYDKLSAEIDNVTNADGQGMRNGVWQMMLLGIPYAYYSELKVDLPELSQDFPIAPIFFQDDHVLMVTFDLPPDVRDEQEITKLKHRFAQRAIPAIISKYARLNLQLEEAKTKYSLTGFILTGDMYDLKGLIPQTGKAISTMLRPSRQHAPCLGSIIADTTTVASSAVLSAQAPDKVWPSMLKCILLKLWQQLSGALSGAENVLPLVLFNNNRAGGLNVPLPQHLNIGLGYAKDVDYAWLLWHHATEKTIFSTYANGVLRRILGLTTDKDKVEVPNVHKSIAINLLKDHYKNIVGYDISAGLLEKNRIYIEMTQSMEQIPPTLYGFCSTLHESIDHIKMLQKMTESATARKLLSNRTINHCALMEQRKSIQYILYWKSAYRASDYVTVKWKEVVQKYFGERIHTPLRVPTCHLLIPSTRQRADLFHHVELHKRAHVEHGKAIAFAKPHPPPVNVGDVSRTGVLGRVLNFEGAIYAAAQEYGYKSDGFRSGLKAMTKFPVLGEQVGVYGSPILTRDVEGMSYTNPAVALWVARKSAEYGLSWTDLDTVSERQNAHMNYGMLMTLAYMQEEGNTVFIAHRGLWWRSPNINSKFKCNEVFNGDESWRKVAIFLRRLAKRMTKDSGQDINLSRNTRDFIRVLEESIKLQQQLEEAKKNFEGDFEQAIMDEFLSTNPHQSDIEVLRDVAPQVLCKWVWQTWVDSIYTRMIMKDKNPYHILTSIPDLTKMEVWQKVRKAPEIEEIMPTDEDGEVLADLADRYGVTNNLLDWLKRMWGQMLKTTLPYASTDLSKFVCDVCRSVPGAYVKSLRLRMSSLPMEMIEGKDKVQLHSFFAMWSDRYLAHSRERLDTVNQFNLMGEKTAPKRGIFVNETHKAAYFGQHRFWFIAIFFKAAAMTVKVANDNTPLKDIFEAAMVATWTSICSHLHVRWKELKIPRFGIYVKDLVSAYKKLGFNGKADVWATMSNWVEERIRVTMQEMNARTLLASVVSTPRYDWEGLHVRVTVASTLPNEQFQEHLRNLSAGDGYELIAHLRGDKKIKPPAAILKFQKRQKERKEHQMESQNLEDITSAISGGRNLPPTTSRFSTPTSEIEEEEPTQAGTSSQRRQKAAVAITQLAPWENQPTRASGSESDTTKKRKTKKSRKHGGGSVSGSETDAEAPRKLVPPQKPPDPPHKDKPRESPVLQAPKWEPGDKVLKTITRIDVEVDRQERAEYQRRMIEEERLRKSLVDPKDKGKPAAMSASVEIAMEVEEDPFAEERLIAPEVAPTSVQKSIKGKEKETKFTEQQEVTAQPGAIPKEPKPQINLAQSVANIVVPYTYKDAYRDLQAARIPDIQLILQEGNVIGNISVGGVSFEDKSPLEPFVKEFIRNYIKRDVQQKIEEVGSAMVTEMEDEPPSNVNTTEVKSSSIVGPVIAEVSNLEQDTEAVQENLGTTVAEVMQTLNYPAPQSSLPTSVESDKEKTSTVVETTIEEKLDF